MRVRAYDRELAAAPRYVANELAGTRQAATARAHDAVLRRAEADGTTDPGRQAQLVTEADQLDDLAAVLRTRAEQLQEVDDARASWLAHTAGTRVQAELSKAELRARDADDDPDDRVTADEWRAAHEEAVADDYRHRQITENDIHDDVAEIDTVGPTGAPGWTDIREQAQTRPRQTREDIVAVPSAEDTADHVRYARRVLDEINYRQAAEAQKEVDERAAELTRWYDEEIAEQPTGDVQEDDGYERVDRS